MGKNRQKKQCAVCLESSRQHVPITKEIIAIYGLPEKERREICMSCFNDRYSHAKNTPERPPAITVSDPMIVEETSVQAQTPLMQLAPVPPPTPPVHEAISDPREASPQLLPANSVPHKAVAMPVAVDSDVASESGAPPIVSTYKTVENHYWPGSASFRY